MKIAIVTGSRADWNGLGMVAKCLRDQGAVVQIVAVGQQANCNESLKTISSDGFKAIIGAPNLKRDSAHIVATNAGRAVEATAKALHEIAPDMVLILGDRFEILSAATAAAIMRIPIAHIGGGDVTEGSIDNKLRYAITALADLHFATNNDSMARMVQEGPPLMGEFYMVGNPAIDRIMQTPVVSRETLFKQCLRLEPQQYNILVVFHSATKEAEPWAECAEMIRALKQLESASFLMLGTNDDVGSLHIHHLLQKFADRHGILRNNLSPSVFYSALTHFDCMVGNSSSGLVETATFGIPVVNIGNRQTGRLSPRNVRTCQSNADAILHTIKIQLAEGRKGCENPYGDGQSAPRISKIMMEYENADRRIESA